MRAHKVAASHESSRGRHDMIGTSEVIVCFQVRRGLSRETFLNNFYAKLGCNVFCLK